MLKGVTLKVFYFKEMESTFLCSRSRYFSVVSPSLALSGPSLPCFLGLS